ncbi:proline-rich protein 15-like [Gouania willdenowi]|uniref:proline-rich protein 15-like n=1 Tax=Gouania willdenowi TaxID=441366 RepID=UPI001056AD3D|nr:proline-rich protein 15-like [Gouania willdenowi]
MTERPKWWKAFLPKKKTGPSKDTPHTIASDFDPSAQRSEKQKDHASSQATKSPQQELSNGSGVFEDDTFDDSHLESMFNEQTCRRKFKVSRSGRFKDKQRIRTTLPTQEKETEKGVAEREDAWWQ